MRFRKPTVEPLEINLTPMIDCLLFLIVFLLMATTFNHFSRINIVLPEAEGVAVTNEGKQIEVAVQKDGTYLVNGLALGSSTEAELINMLQKEAGSNRKQLFVIAADAEASHQAVVRVMDVAGKMGFLNLNISTVVPAPQSSSK
ncbi:MULTISPECIES: ExbD/TolR family protein [Moraxella]|uniref:Biopolymer transport protein ExbD n=2 Tax=Moraxella TaxID=475 RepID=A0A1T0A8P4_MORBO|nr:MULTISPECIES: biopolymer transporter ExbD [Moraxella]AWY19733.1 biopolymer transporter ExbD [Moraxella bovis]OOR91978.1 biopolymer transporter ExbD [Moraxella bovis]OPH39672.1 biopolymer transporter ExbD [Moraxella equi]UYZ67905.1 biopolymer transporter ExbD [Moraxella bovis]UYZ70279.1 biopolymer transporter ExbD [Moraxella bovis]